MVEHFKNTFGAIWKTYIVELPVSGAMKDK